MMKKYTFLIISLFTSFALKAQTTAASYGFSAFSSTYSSISSSGTSSSSISSDDIASIYSLGFNFVYCGVTYTQAYVSSNGNVQLGTTCGSSVFSNYLAGLPCGGAGVLMPCWDDLWGVGHTAYYSTTGVAPNRIFTFEWNNWALYSWTGQHANFQVKLYETSNIIDFCYGTSSYTSNSATIGIANSFTDYQTLPDHSTSPTPSASTFTTTISGSPVNGQVYRWSPNCTGTPSSGTISATSTTGCGSYSSTLTLTGESTGSTYTYQWQSSTDGTTWSNISGATTTTYTGTVTANTYYRCIVTCTTSGLSSTTSSIELLYNAIPSGITGTTTVCEGGNVTLSDVTTGGTWTSSSSNATVGATTGIVTGVTAGTATITYTITSTGCYVSIPVTVNATPTAILGTTTVCLGGTSTLSDAIGGGTWSSVTTGVAGIGSATGVMTGAGAGTSVISYILSDGCYTTTTATVNPGAGTITGADSVCTGSTILLSDVISAGTWSVTGGASIVGTSGVLTGVSAGTATVTYTITSTGCYTTYLVTVNSTPPAITGSHTVCVGGTTILSNTMAGGNWTSSTPGTASIDATGTVSGVLAGTATISYTMPTGGCYTTFTETVNPLPAAISGTDSVCVNATVTLSDATGGGTWSTTSGTATVVSGTGVVTGTSAGMATITYTLGTSCYETFTMTVNAIPAPITGVANVCALEGTTTLADITGGGI